MIGQHTPSATTPQQKLCYAYADLQTSALLLTAVIKMCSEGYSAYSIHVSH